MISRARLQKMKQICQRAQHHPKNQVRDIMELVSMLIGHIEEQDRVIFRYKKALDTLVDMRIEQK